MKTLLIVYHERLGDIARCLPIAKHFHRQGWLVRFECKPEYFGLFEMVDYATPQPQDTGMLGDDRVLDLQIWPARMDMFIRSGLSWMDYVYGLFPEGKDIDRNIDLDLDETSHVSTPEWLRDACLVFPNGYSQMRAPDPHRVVVQAHRLFPGEPVCVIGKRDLGCHELEDIPTLVRWIWRAKHVLTVNTAASILASAVRTSWHHIPDLDPQHDFTHPNQIRVGRLA